MMTANQNGVNRINGTPAVGRVDIVKSPAKRRGGKAKPRAMVARSPKLALTLTVTMGVAIPLLSLSLSTVAGTLARTGHAALAVGGLALCATVLAVSLSHLAWAVADITKSGKAASWCLAVAVDLTIVLCESVSVFADDAGLNVLVTAMMVAVTGASMALNVWAFLRHRN